MTFSAPKDVQGMMELFNNPHLSDVTLVVEERQIPAHRHVLATHSHMFDRMWNHSMKEVCAGQSRAIACRITIDSAVNQRHCLSLEAIMGGQTLTTPQ